ncbi:MAG TPA: response regulator [Polyangiales bacterium]|nr:response regulator [Polyangiales bacterium]
MRPAILAVDDDATNRHVIGEILRRDQMDVSFADSAEQALRLLDSQEARFDIVLLDRMMSGIDGIEVLKRMKSAPHLAATPVVMQTAAGAPDQITEGLLAGAHYYLTKPYSPDSLRTIVRAALTDARARSELQLRADSTAHALGMIQHGVFECRTLDEAQTLAGLLAQLSAEPRVAVVGLFELLGNAVEHGNLGIDCQLKSALIRSDRWLAEVRRRQQLPEYRDKLVRVELDRAGDELAVCVRDQGDGFDFAKYLELDPTRAFEPNGRGIALARLMSFRTLSYEAPGNVARATLKAAARPTRN